mmetsp:Transcript_26800/g.70367  ORF Transcript_26800/g.70367 Transcript_26800/m.70367 type:complete len:207 (-) Transcript_26800:476-1096(-)
MEKGPWRYGNQVGHLAGLGHVLQQPRVVVAAVAEARHVGARRTRLRRQRQQRSRGAAVLAVGEQDDAAHGVPLAAPRQHVDRQLQPGRDRGAATRCEGDDGGLGGGAAGVGDAGEGRQALGLGVELDEGEAVGRAEQVEGGEERLAEVRDLVAVHAAAHVKDGDEVDAPLAFLGAGSSISVGGTHGDDCGEFLVGLICDGLMLALD